jgi:A118 family predicted phage portal protein
VDLIEQADRLYSNLVWEFESGKRALYVDALAFDKDPNTGLPRLPDKRLFRTLNTTGQIGKAQELFEEWSPEFREAQINSGLNSLKREIEFTCGLEYGSISDPQVEAKTATEIKSSKQRTYATITDTQKALETALEDLLYAMDVWATLGKLAPGGAYQAKYEFDDSIVSDHDTQFLQDQQTVTMSAMPKYQFLVRNYGMTEVEAKKWVTEAQEESAAAADLLGFGAGGDGTTPPQDGSTQPANQGA